MRTALVTGASSGVGAAIAVALGGRGDDVWLVARDEERLAKVARAVSEAGGSARPHAADLTDGAAVEALARDVAASRSSVDVLVHAAGVIRPGQPVAELGADDLDAQLAVNLRAPVLLTRALLPAMTAGDIVFVNSNAATRGVAGSSAYAAAKAALRSFADSLREEVNPHGVRVLTVMLGRTATPMQEALHESEGVPYDPAALIQPTDVAAMVLAALALPRAAEVTEITLRPARKPAQ